MRVSLNWLKEYVDIDISAEELAHQLTMLGLEIESIERPGAEISDVYIGKILSIDPHPDADKLVVCKTDIGKAEPLQIVCGAKNMKPGDYVPTAVIGAKLPGGFEIGKRKMRGIESQGMMCSARELGMGEDHSGLLILQGEPPLGMDAKTLLGLDDVIFEVSITPNRGDWACMIGIAREVAALFGKTVRIPAITLTESSTAASSLSSVTIEDADLCPRYIGRVLKNVTIKPSPEWMCRCLIAAGQRPINNIVDITNYVLLETGHPLHAFDYEKLGENRIVVRRAKPGEVMTTLDGEKRTLAEDMLVIADAREPQAVAGIMGGGDSEVDENTKNVFLESAYFKPASIRRTSRQLGLATEASQRFQRGADPEMAVYAINRAAELMQQLGGAEIAQGLLDEYPNCIPVREVRMRYARCNLLIGTEIPEGTQRDALVKLGFEITASDAESATFRVPTWRPDVSMEVDLIEEVARLYGYDNVEMSLPQVRQSEMVFAPYEAKVRQMRRQLVAQGLTEIYQWTFSCPDDVQRAGLDAAYLNMVTLQNPLSENQATMRSSMIPGLMNNAAYNVSHGVADMAVFEIGPVYRPIDGADQPEQRLCLGMLLMGKTEEKHWSSPQRSVDFYDLKGRVEAVLDFFGQSAVFNAVEYGPFQSGQSAVIMSGNDTVGYMGKMARTVLKAYDIEQDIYVAELYLDPLLTRGQAANQFQEIPAFPPSLRDLAVVVNASVPSGDLVKVIQDNGGKNLRQVDIFDIYTGEPVPKGKKSVALSLMFQSGERTLTDEETQKAMDKIVRKLQTEYEAELR